MVIVPQFIVFDCPQYYPSGGWDDVKFWTDNKEAADAMRKQLGTDAYVVDLGKELVERGL